MQALANVAEFSVQCTKCKEDTPYADMVVKDRIVAGLANISIKEDVLAHDSLKEWNVNDLVTYIKGK